MTMSDTDLATQIAELRAEVRRSGLEVDELRNEIGAMREQLATEVRTKRLVVVDDQGREVIRTKITDSQVELRAEWGDEDGPAGATAMLHAGDELAEGQYDAGYAVSADGNIIGWLWGSSSVCESDVDVREREGRPTLSRESTRRHDQSERHMAVEPDATRTSRCITTEGGGVVRFDYQPG
jgi:hypothetical protein